MQLILKNLQRLQTFLKLPKVVYLFIPSVYKYWAAVTYKMHSLYTYEDSKSSKTMEKIIKSGLEIEFKPKGNSTGFKAGVSNEISDKIKAAEKSNMKSETVVTTEAYGW